MAEGQEATSLLNGARSGWRTVLRGVPQGSILGLLLFLIFINDFEFGLLNSVFKFADDIKFLDRATTDKDCPKLQMDLDALCSWSDKWLMKFNMSQ